MGTRVWTDSDTIVEGVDFDERAGAVVVSVRPVARARGSVWALRLFVHRVTTVVRVVGDGGRWISGRRRCLSRRTRRGFGAASTG